MWDILIILLVLSIFFWKKILLFVLNIVITILIFPLALISAAFNWEPKFIKRWEQDVKRHKEENK